MKMRKSINTPVLMLYCIVASHLQGLWFDHMFRYLSICVGFLFSPYGLHLGSLIFSHLPKTWRWRRDSKITSRCMRVCMCMHVALQWIRVYSQITCSVARIVPLYLYPSILNSYWGWMLWPLKNFLLDRMSLMIHLLEGFYVPRDGKENYSPNITPN